MKNNQYKYWYCLSNGMIGKYKHSPGNNWIGPYDTIRDCKTLTEHITVNQEKIKDNENT